MKIGIIIIILAVVAGAWFYFNKTPAPTPVSNPASQNTPQKTTHNVLIQGFAFDQKSISIKKGEAVTWTNKDSAPHTVTGDNGEPQSSTINKSGTYSFTFSTPGTFSYHCAFHPSMKGTIVVE